MLGTFVVKGKFFSKMGEEQEDDRMWEWSQSMYKRDSQPGHAWCTVI